MSCVLTARLVGRLRTSCQCLSEPQVGPTSDGIAQVVRALHQRCVPPCSSRAGRDAFRAHHGRGASPLPRARLRPADRRGTGRRGPRRRHLRGCSPQPAALRERRPFLRLRSRRLLRLLGELLVRRPDGRRGALRCADWKTRPARGRRAGSGRGGAALARRRLAHAVAPSAPGAARRRAPASAARPRARAGGIHRAHPVAERETAAGGRDLGSGACTRGGRGAAGAAGRGPGRAGAATRAAADRVPARIARACRRLRPGPGAPRSRHAWRGAGARRARARGAGETSGPPRRIRAGGARGGRTGIGAQAARSGHRALGAVPATGLGPERAAAAHPDVRSPAPLADLLPAAGRDRARAGGGPFPKRRAREAASAGAVRRPGGAGRGGRQPAAGGADARSPPRARAPHPRSRPGAVREGRRVAPGAPRRAAGLGADARRVPQGPARFLAGGVPARRRRGAHVKRSLLLLALIACSRPEDREAPRPPAGEVWLSRQQLEAQQMGIEVIAEQEVTTTLDTPARIAFDDMRVAHVFAPVSGRIISIAAAPGQQVRKGDPLVEIESPDVGAALSDLGKAEADVTAAERELVEAHAAAQRELDQAQGVYDRASAELARARRRAGLFRGRGSGGVTQRFFVRSPIDGEVIARTASPGTDVQGQLSGGNAPELFTIGSIDPVWVYAEVYEADLARVKLGAPVQVKVIAYPDTSFAGRIEWISSTLDPVTRTARLRCTLRNAGRELLPEMYATVSVATPPRKALVVPRSAVLHVGEERVVFVQTGATENGLLKFQRRRVVLEERETDPVPVKAGLQPGEAVVVSGALLLSGML